MVVDRNRVIAVVERFHPVVVDLKIPVLTLGRRHFHQEGFVFFEFPVAVVVDDIGVSVGGLRDRGVKERQFVGFRREGFRPIREERGRPVHIGGRRREALVDEFGGHRIGGGRCVDPFDPKVGNGLVRPVFEGLPHDQRTGVGLHGQPVPGMLPATQDDFETPILRHLEIGRLEVAALSHPPSRAVVSDIGAEPQVVHGAPASPNPVVVGSRNRSALVVVVRVVGADLDGFMRGSPKHRRPGIRGFDVRFESNAGQATQVTKSLGALKGIPRRSVAENHVARLLQPVAKIGPALALQNSAFGITLHVRTSSIRDG